MRYIWRCVGYGSIHKETFLRWLSWADISEQRSRLETKITELFPINMAFGIMRKAAIAQRNHRVRRTRKPQVMFKQVT